MRSVFLLLAVFGLFTEKMLGSSQLLSSVDDLYLEGRTSGDLPIDDEDGDDDDEGSGSGSGDYGLITEEAELLKFLNFSKTLFDRVDTVPVEPHQPQPTTPAPEPGPTAAETETELQTTDRAPREPTTREEEEVVDASPTVDSARRTSAETPTSTLGNSLDLDQNQDQDWLEPAVSDTELHNEIVPADPRGRMYELDAPKEVTSENLWERTDVLAAIIACGVVGFLCAVFLLLLLAYRMKKKDEGSYDLGETKLTNTAYHKAPTKEFYA
ncbi:unnamed protein product [Knipowitschia caucasica]